MDDEKIIKFKASPEKEAVFKENGCKFVPLDQFCWEEYTFTFTTETYQLSKIDHEKSRLHCQNRLDTKLRKEYVTGWAAAMDEGDVFPALAIFRDEETKKHLLADGFHTCGAAQYAKAEAVEGVYFFNHPDPIKIAVEMNRFASVPESIEDRNERAVRDYMALKVRAQRTGEKVPSQSSWARDKRLHSERFNVALRVAETKQWLGKHDIDTKSLTEKEAILAINTLKGSDESMALRVAEMAVKYNVGSGDISNLKDTLSDPTKPLTQRLAMLDKAEAEIRRNTSNGSKKRSDKKRTKEEVWADAVVMLANRFPTLDGDIIKTLLVNPKYQKATQELEKIISTLNSLKK